MSIIRNLFFQYQAQTSPSPFIIEVEKAEGVYIYDNQGNKYIDLISGIAVSNVGHCAPEVVKAIQTQAAIHMHTMVYGEHVHRPAALFAQRIIECLNNELEVVYFVNSGAEAVEGALKVAKKFTGRKGLISCYNSYHGSTHGALSVTSNDWIKEGYGPFLPEVSHIRFNHTEDLVHITEDTAAVIIEPIQGEAGVILPKADFLWEVRKRCNETGALMILDEIQTGFGRTGKLFAHSHFGIVPDILLSAKGMGGGMPIGAFIGKRNIMESLMQNPILGHITTFGGHPVSCAAGLATLEKILDDQLLTQMPEKSALIQQMLQHPKIKGIRGIGLMWAVELQSFEQVLAVTEVAIKKGVVTDWFLNCTHSLRIAPPLTISLTELTQALEVLLQAIEEVNVN